MYFIKTSDEGFWDCSSFKMEGRLSASSFAISSLRPPSNTPNSASPDSLNCVRFSMATESLQLTEDVTCGEREKCFI